MQWNKDWILAVAWSRYYTQDDTLCSPVQYNWHQRCLPSWNVTSPRANHPSRCEAINTSTKVVSLVVELGSLQLRYNGCESVSNHQPHDCLPNRLFRRRSKRRQSSASLAFVRGIHRSLVNSPHKWPVTRKKLPFIDAIMSQSKQTVAKFYTCSVWFCVLRYEDTDSTPHTIPTPGTSHILYL